MASPRSGYFFEVNLGNRCNMRCKFCFEQGSGYTNIAASKEDLSYFAGYMRYTKERARTSVKVSIFGGEPLVHLDTLVPFIHELSSFADYAEIVTNGLGVQQHEAEIDEMQSAMGVGRFSVAVSYNFTLQDETRQAGTYEKIRDSIRLLCSKGYFVNSPVVFTPDTIHRIGEMFDDFMALRRETGGRNRLTFNYFVPEGVPFSVVKEDVLRAELARIKSAIEDPANGLTYETFRYRTFGAHRSEHRRDCIFQDVRAALCPDGAIYPGYDVMHSTEYAKNLLRIGRVGDPYRQLDINIRRLMRTLNNDPPKQCWSCPSQCRMVPWRTLKDDVSQYNQMPSPARCKVVGIIGEYLPIAGVSRG